jgi:hypothetical protein
MDIQFYDVKSKQKVGIPVKDIKKITYERKTKDGKTVVRYALKAEYNGTNLTKFVSKADWDTIEN